MWSWSLGYGPQVRRYNFIGYMKSGRKAKKDPPFLDVQHFINELRNIQNVIQVKRCPYMRYFDKVEKVPV